MKILRSLVNFLKLEVCYIWINSISSRSSSNNDNICQQAEAHPILRDYVDFISQKCPNHDRLHKENNHMFKLSGGSPIYLYHVNQQTFGVECAHFFLTFLEKS